MPVTRLGPGGYGVRRTGSFAGKTAAPSYGPHPVGVLSRFGLAGYGVRRAGDFSGKVASLPPLTVKPGGGNITERRGGYRRKRKLHDVIAELLEETSASAIRQAAREEAEELARDALLDDELDELSAEIEAEAHRKTSQRSDRLARIAVLAMRRTVRRIMDDEDEAALLLL